MQQWFGEHSRTIKWIAIAGLGVLAVIIGLDWLNSRGKSATAATTPDPNAAPTAPNLGTIDVNITDNQYQPPTYASPPPAPQPGTPPTPQPIPGILPLGLVQGHEGGPVPVPAIHPAGLNSVSPNLPPDFSYFDATYYPTQN